MCFCSKMLRFRSCPTDVIQSRFEEERCAFRYAFGSCPAGVPKMRFMQDHVRFAVQCMDSGPAPKISSSRCFSGLCACLLLMYVSKPSHKDVFNVIN